MIEKLHNMGFKVMLWVCPYVSADGFKFDAGNPIINENEETSWKNERLSP